MSDLLYYERKQSTVVISFLLPVSEDAKSFVSVGTSKRKLPQERKRKTSRIENDGCRDIGKFLRPVKLHVNNSIHHFTPVKHPMKYKISFLCQIL